MLTGRKNNDRKDFTEDYGLTVSEFIRYKIFGQPAPAAQEPEILRYIMPDEEREAMENLIQEQRERIAQLTTELRQATQDQICLSGNRQRVNAQLAGLQSEIEALKNVKLENDPEVAAFFEWLETTKDGKECLHNTGMFFSNADLSGLDNQKLMKVSVLYVANRLKNGNGIWADTEFPEYLHRYIKTEAKQQQEKESWD